MESTAGICTLGMTNNISRSQTQQATATTCESQRGQVYFLQQTANRLKISFYLLIIDLTSSKHNHEHTTTALKQHDDEVLREGKYIFFNKLSP